jgi:hypothetical protein
LFATKSLHVDDIERRNIMSTKLTITAAALLAVLAVPALAGDQDVATELQDSGRYVPQANLPEVRTPGMGLRSHAFASAATDARIRASGAFASAVRPVRTQAPRSFVTTPSLANDFQLQGR